MMIQSAKNPFRLASKKMSSRCRDPLPKCRRLIKVVVMWLYRERLVSRQRDIALLMGGVGIWLKLKLVFTVAR